MVRQSSNSYANGSDQNRGNVLTDTPSTRVLAPPGGRSSISLGWDVDEQPQEQRRGTAAAVRAAHLHTSCAEVGGRGNFKVGWPATADLENFEVPSQASRGPRSPYGSEFNGPSHGYENRSNGCAPPSPHYSEYGGDDRRQAQPDRRMAQNMDDYDRDQYDQRASHENGPYNSQRASYEKGADDYGEREPRFEQRQEQGQDASPESSPARRQFQQEFWQQEAPDIRVSMQRPTATPDADGGRRQFQQEDAHGGRRQFQQDREDPRDARGPAPRAFGAREDRGERVSSNRFANSSNQNCGNMITERPTTRVVAPPGGKSTFSIGWANEDDSASRPQQRTGRGGVARPTTAPAPDRFASPRGGDDVGASRGYRPSIRTSAPPGGEGAFGTDWSSNARTGPPAGRGEDEANRFYQGEDRRMGKQYAQEQPRHFAEKEARDSHRYHLEGQGHGHGDYSGRR